MSRSLSPRQARVLRLLASHIEPIPTWHIARALRLAYAPAAATVWALARRGLALPHDTTPAVYGDPDWRWSLTQRARRVWK